MAQEAPRVPVRVVHAMPGRLRLRLEEPPEAAMEIAAGDALLDRLARVPGIERALWRPATGSLILTGDGDLEAALRAAEVLEIRPKLRPPPVGQVARLGLLRLDAGMKARTQGTLDLRAAIAVLLIGGAIMQLARGRVAGPATTLMMSALSLIELPKR